MAACVLRSSQRAGGLSMTRTTSVRARVSVSSMPLSLPVRFIRVKPLKALEVPPTPKGKPRVLTLNTLQDNPGAHKKRRQKGRGPGSSKGKTSGRGHKGANSRSGNKFMPWFEGGQTPLYRRLPKRGFSRAMFQSIPKPLSCQKLMQWVQEGRINSDELIDLKVISDSNVIGKIKPGGVKLLARGAHRIDRPLHLHVTAVSQTAKQAIEEKGGSVTRVYWGRPALRAHLHPELYEGRLVPHRGHPKPRDAWKYDLPPAPPTYNRALIYQQEQAQLVAKRKEEEAKKAAAAAAKTTGKAKGKGK